MYRRLSLVSAIAIALSPAALHATTVEPSSGSIAGSSLDTSRTDAMAEALSRIGLYRFGTRLMFVTKPAAPAPVVVPAPIFAAPSPPPPAPANCGSSTPAPAPSAAPAAAPAASLPTAAPPVPQVAPPPVFVDVAAPYMPSSQARLQEFFNQVLGARSRLKVITLAPPPVAAPSPAPAPVVAAPVASAAPISANCAPSEQALPPAAAEDAPPALLAGLEGGPDGPGEQPDDWFVDAIDPPREGSEVPMDFVSDGPLPFTSEEQQSAGDVPGLAAPDGQVPEPGSLALLGLGLLGIGMSRRRMAAR